MAPQTPDSPTSVDPRAYLPGHHSVSPFNYAPDVQASYEFAEPFRVVDSTLRKIIKTTGVRPRVPDLLQVAEALAEVGVEDTIMNLSWYGDPEPASIEYKALRAVTRHGLPFQVTVFADALMPTEIYGPKRYPAPLAAVLDRLQEAGARRLALDVPWHPADSESLGSERRARFEEVVAECRRRTLEYGVHVADPARMPFDGVVAALNAGLREGAVRVDISDSYSSLAPEGMKLFVRNLRAGLERQVPISMHTHNDFGLANASAIAAATAGANPDVAVNGLSYRSGFASLEEVVLALELLYGIKTGIRLEKLQWLSDLVEERTGMGRHPLKPVTGRHAYLRDHPMWMLQYLEGSFPPSASCYEPAIVGARMGMVWTVHPGNAVIRAKLEQMGLTAGEEAVDEIRRRLDRALAAKRRYPFWVDEAEMEQLCREVAG